ncbi:MAG TPA: SPOR domain-containing protein [Cyclobacteriaceae bacterium]|nr:SPOR domain-containing protein [Cyclobacteriaceae bacterium]
MFRHILHFLVCIVLAGCATQKPTDKPYYENLSAHRPKVVLATETAGKHTTTQTPVIAAVTPTHNVNEKIDVVLDSIDRYNQVRKFIDGYTIQIYSGQNREEAMEAKKKMTTNLPEYIANLQYQQPKFRVTVGRYFTKLEAHPDLVKLRNNFTAAILVPEKIPVR